MTASVDLNPLDLGSYPNDTDYLAAAAPLADYAAKVQIAPSIVPPDADTYAIILEYTSGISSLDRIYLDPANYITINSYINNTSATIGGVSGLYLYQQPAAGKLVIGRPGIYNGGGFALAPMTAGNVANILAALQFSTVDTAQDQR